MEGKAKKKNYKLGGQGSWRKQQDGLDRRWYRKLICLTHEDVKNVTN
jgi:hypothetical protein